MHLNDLACWPALLIWKRLFSGFMPFPSPSPSPWIPNRSTGEPAYRPHLIGHMLCYRPSEADFSLSVVVCQCLTQPEHSITLSLILFNRVAYILLIIHWHLLKVSCFICSSIHPSIHPLTHSLIHSFNQSIIHSFNHSFIHSMAVFILETDYPSERTWESLIVI